jgi:hypothetical protein
LGVVVGEPVSPSVCAASGKPGGKTRGSRLSCLARRCDGCARWTRHLIGGARVWSATSTCCLFCLSFCQADVDLLAEREKLLDAWREWQSGRAAWVEEAQQGRLALLSARYDVLALEGDFTVEEVEVEETIEVKEEPYR